MALKLNKISNGFYEVYCTDKREVIGFMLEKTKRMHYSRELADIICERLASGEMISKICKSDGMPNYTTVKKWYRQHEEFQEMYDQAMEDRGDTYFDKVMETVEEAGQGEIPQAKLKSDAYKWAAQISNPKQYQKQTKVDHSIGIANLNVITGIVRDEKLIEASREVEEISGNKTDSKASELLDDSNDVGDASKTDD